MSIYEPRPTITVCIPAHNEESTVGNIVRHIREQYQRRRQLIDEIIVVDDRASDRTAQVAWMVESLFAPLLDNPIITLVKGSFCRMDKTGNPVVGGRVTTLTARPLLEMFFPRLEHLRDPLSGMFEWRQWLCVQSSRKQTQQLFALGTSD